MQSSAAPSQASDRIWCKREKAIVADPASSALFSACQRYNVILRAGTHTNCCVWKIQRNCYWERIPGIPETCQREKPPASERWRFEFEGKLTSASGGGISFDGGIGLCPSSS